MTNDPNQGEIKPKRSDVINASVRHTGLEVGKEFDEEGKESLSKDLFNAGIGEEGIVDKVVEDIQAGVTGLTEGNATIYINRAAEPDPEFHAQEESKAYGEDGFVKVYRGEGEDANSFYVTVNRPDLNAPLEEQIS